MTETKRNEIQKATAENGYFNIIQSKGFIALGLHILKEQGYSTNKSKFDLIKRSIKKVEWDNISKIEDLNEFLKIVHHSNELIAFVYKREKHHGDKLNFQDFKNGITFSLENLDGHRIKYYVQFKKGKEFITTDIGKFIGGNKFSLKRSYVKDVIELPEMQLTFAYFLLDVAGEVLEINIVLGYKEDKLN